MNDNARVRVHIVGVVVTALFCSLLARLWFLDSSVTAQEVSLRTQKVRTVATPSSRGLIYDSAGRLLVGNRVSWAISADAELRAAPRDSPTRQVVPKIATLLGMTADKVTEILDSKRLGPLESVVLATEVSAQTRTRLVEYGEEYPHVQLAAVDVRTYAYPGVAPQLLGYLGRVTQADIKKHPDYGNNEDIGRAGIEAVYESMLRGQPSKVDVAVDGRGIITGDPVNRSDGAPGLNVNLTIDADLQRFAEQSLQEGIDMARSENNEDFPQFSIPYRAPAGAVIVLDTTDGSVKAMASNPGYDNSLEIGDQMDALTAKGSNTPLINRATRGLYPPGSTFKMISAIASAQTETYGIFTPVNEGDGCYRRGEKFKVCSPGGGGGSVDLREALTVSSDVYFYSVGDALWARWNAGDKDAGYKIQNTARAFGFGSKTGIDIDEVAGRVPDEAWKRAFAREIHKPQDVDAFDDWNPGDNISLAVGQGDLLVSPLQLANAYAALANGGTLWRPRLVGSITNAAGEVVANAASKPSARNRVELSADLRSALFDGFGGVVDSTSGTAQQAFRGFPLDQVRVWGKTGTAQVGPGKKTCVDTVNGAANHDRCLGDTSWFVSMVAPPGSDTAHPRYVVLAMVEQGGRGGRIAAPIARQVIEHMNKLPITPIPRLAPAVVSGNDKG